MEMTAPIFDEGIRRRLQAGALYCSLAFETALQVCVAYHYWSQPEWAGVILAILLTSAVLVNAASIVSVHRSLDFSGRWFGQCICYVLHFTLFGPTWRFLKLAFVYDRTDVREFAILRYVQSHLQTLPSLLVQIFLLYRSPWTSEAVLLPAVVAGIQLASVSVTVVIAGDIISDIEDPLYAVTPVKYTSPKSDLKKPKTMLPPCINHGFRTVCFLWCRVLSLGVFTSELKYWVFLIIGIHWISVLVWLLRHQDGSQITGVQKVLMRSLQSFLLIFNWSPKLIDNGSFLSILEQEAPVKVLNVAIYYAIVGSENALMLSLWFHLADQSNPVVRLATVASCAGTFAFGLLSLALTTPECWLKPEDNEEYDERIVFEEKRQYTEIPSDTLWDYHSIANTSSNSRNTNTIDPNICEASTLDDIPYLTPRPTIALFSTQQSEYPYMKKPESVYRDPSSFTGSLSTIRHAHFSQTLPQLTSSTPFKLPKRFPACHCKIFDEAGHSLGHRLSCPGAFQRLDPKVYVGTLMDVSLDLDPINPSTGYPSDSEKASMSSVTTAMESELTYSTWPPSQYLPSMTQLFGTARPAHDSSLDYVRAWLVTSTLPVRRPRPPPQRAPLGKTRARKNVEIIV